jgi:hypothetical protein
MTLLTRTYLRLAVGTLQPAPLLLIACSVFGLYSSPTSLLHMLWLL